MAKGKKTSAVVLPSSSENTDAEHSPVTNKVTVGKVSSPNDELELEEFNYDSLTGESFKDYVRLAGDHSAIEIVNGKETPIRGELEQNKAYDFVLLKAKPVMQERFPGMKDSPWDYVGLIAEGKTLHTTRIPLKTALEHNRQILNAHSRAGHGKYYFLKK